MTAKLCKTVYSCSKINVFFTLLLPFSFPFCISALIVCYHMIYTRKNHSIGTPFDLTVSNTPTNICTRWMSRELILISMWDFVWISMIITLYTHTTKNCRSTKLFFRSVIYFPVRVFMSVGFVASPLDFIPSISQYHIIYSIFIYIKLSWLSHTLSSLFTQERFVSFRYIFSVHSCRLCLNFNLELVESAFNFELKKLAQWPFVILSELSCFYVLFFYMHYTLWRSTSASYILEMWHEIPFCCAVFVL